MSGNQTNRTWQAALLLFIMESNGRIGTPGYPTCGDGWRDLVETADRRIATAVSGSPPGAVRLVQTKQKYATLRIYWSGGPGLADPVRKAVEDAIDLGDARSACTCEQCGEAGRLFKSGGWFLTACDIHAKGRPAARPGMENIHVQQKFVNGEFRTVRCRRYIRETDKFVDIELPSAGAKDSADG